MTGVRRWRYADGLHPRRVQGMLRPDNACEPAERFSTVRQQAGGYRGVFVPDGRAVAAEGRRMYSCRRKMCRSFRKRQGTYAERIRPRRNIPSDSVRRRYGCIGERALSLESQSRRPGSIRTMPDCSRRDCRCGAGNGGGRRYVRREIQCMLHALPSVRSVPAVLREHGEAPAAYRADTSGYGRRCRVRPPIRGRGHCSPD